MECKEWRWGKTCYIFSWRWIANSLIVWRVLILNWFYVWMDKKDLHSFKTLWSLILQIEFILEWNNVNYFFKTIRHMKLMIFVSYSHLFTIQMQKRFRNLTLKTIYLLEQNKYHFDLFAMIVIRRLWPITKSIILNHHFLPND